MSLANQLVRESAKVTVDAHYIFQEMIRNMISAIVSVGVVLPQGGHSGINTFDICQDGKCVEGGKLHTYGALNDTAIYEPPHKDEKNYFLRETDVTDVIAKQGWTLRKPLVAKMTNTVVENSPEPVVILKLIDKSGKYEKHGKITLNPKEKRQHYGNLIDKYRIVANFLDLDLKQVAADVGEHVANTTEAALGTIGGVLGIHKVNKAEKGPITFFYKITYQYHS